MRLGGCVLIELLAGVSLLAGTGVGSYLGARTTWTFFDKQAHARSVADALSSSSVSSQFTPTSSSSLPASPLATNRVSFFSTLSWPPSFVAQDSWRLLTLSVARLDAPARLNPVATPFGVFRGIRDDYLLEPLRDSTVVRSKFNRGGSSISLRVDFSSGARAAFKPEQTNLQSIPRKEVAAYRIDRLLGINAVPPAIARELPVADLIARLDPGSRALLPRFMREAKQGEEGTVAGELSWWIPELVDARIEGFEIDDVNGIVLWKRYLTVGAPVPVSAERLVEQISKMVSFDFLINNPDRWSGANTKTSPDGRVLFFMDNTMSFGPEPSGVMKVHVYLGRVQRFSRSLYQALRRLSLDDLREAMLVDTGPYEQLLSDREMDAVITRRDRLVDYIDSLIAAHGEQAVLVFQ
ncbi:MAG: hypothetical protein V2A73_18455 [Pseudomonadota bacterium]